MAPLSGHFATLLRDTVRVLLPEHDVHITDWANARDVGIWHGRFGFDEYVEHLIWFLRAMGPGSHVVAVCQPCVQALAAAALMAEDDHPCQPLSLTLMAGPIDTRINPTKVNELATGQPISWFERNLIARVPLRYPGATRRVYPGFLQLTAFMSMNAERHIKAQVDLYKAMAKGERAEAKTIKDFYDEYFAVLDMTAEFYLETVQWVFQEFRLARGQLDWRDRRVHPKAIRRTALFTIEGERDDICSIGQTVAAHDLCTSLRPYRKKHYMQAGVGHYGVFSGQAVGQPDLSLGAEHDPGQRMTRLPSSCLLPRLTGEGREGESRRTASPISDLKFSSIVSGACPLPTLPRMTGEENRGRNALDGWQNRLFALHNSVWLTFRRRPRPTGKSSPPRSCATSPCRRSTG